MTQHMAERHSEPSHIATAGIVKCITVRIDIGYRHLKSRASARPLPARTSGESTASLQRAGAAGYRLHAVVLIPPLKRQRDPQVDTSRSRLVVQRQSASDARWGGLNHRSSLTTVAETPKSARPQGLLRVAGNACTAEMQLFRTYAGATNDTSKVGCHISKYVKFSCRIGRDLDVCRDGRGILRGKPVAYQQLSCCFHLTDFSRRG
jgi:hypothetical protein